MGGSGGKCWWMARKHVVYEYLFFMFLCAVQLGTVYFHIASSAQFSLWPFLIMADEVRSIKDVRYVPIKVTKGGGLFESRTTPQNFF